MSSVLWIAQDWVILLRRSEHTGSKLLAHGTARGTLREDIPVVKLGRSSLWWRMETKSKLWFILLGLRNSKSKKQIKPNQTIFKPLAIRVWSVGTAGSEAKAPWEAPLYSQRVSLQPVPSPWFRVVWWSQAHCKDCWRTLCSASGWGPSNLTCSSFHHVLWATAPISLVSRNHLKTF